MAAEQWELAMEQKWPKTYHYYLEVLKQMDYVLEFLDKIQVRTWLVICLIVFLVALFAMTGKTDFQLNQIIQQSGLEIETLAKESAELKEQQKQQLLNVQANQQKLEEMAIMQEQQQLQLVDHLNMQHSIEELTKRMAEFSEEKLGKEIAEEFKAITQEEHRAILIELKRLEQKAQIWKEELKQTIQQNGITITALVKAPQNQPISTIQTEQLKANIPEENQSILIELKALEQKAQMGKNELKQTIQQNGITIAAVVKEVAELKTQQNQLISTIQTEQRDMEEVASEKANPTEQQQQEQQQKEESNKSTNKSTHLIKDNNPANPFKYDIKTCPGLVFD